MGLSPRSDSLRLICSGFVGQRALDHTCRREGPQKCSRETTLPCSHGECLIQPYQQPGDGMALKLYCTETKGH